MKDNRPKFLSADRGKCRTKCRLTWKIHRKGWNS